MNFTRGKLAIVAGLVALVAGCGSLPHRAKGSPTVNAAWQSCDAVGALPSQDVYKLPLLDGSFTPVTAVLCRNADNVAVEDRATDITTLLADLRLPDQRGPKACPANLYTPPLLFLLDAQGRWIRPGMPVNGCNQPRYELQNDFHDLRTTRVIPPAARK